MPHLFPLHCRQLVAIVPTDAPDLEQTALGNFFAFSDGIFADSCSAILLVVLMYFIGGLMVQRRSRLYLWGWRLAATAFLACCGMGIVYFLPTSASALVHVMIRSLYAGTFCLGASWIALAAADFILALGLRPWYRMLYHCNQFVSRRQSARQLLEASDRRRAEAEWERQEAAERTARQEVDCERARQEIAVLRQQEAQARQRRSDARTTCEIFFNLHPEIGKRFTKAMFDDFAARHFGDTHSPDYVERRAEQLLDLLRQHLAKVVPPLADADLEGILAAFAERVRRIEASTLDERDKEYLLLQLDEEREDMIRRSLREGRL